MGAFIIFDLKYYTEFSLLNGILFVCVVYLSIELESVSCPFEKIKQEKVKLVNGVVFRPLIDLDLDAKVDEIRRL